MNVEQEVVKTFTQMDMALAVYCVVAAVTAVVVAIVDGLTNPDSDALSVAFLAACVGVGWPAALPILAITVIVKQARIFNAALAKRRDGKG